MSGSEERNSAMSMSLEGRAAEGGMEGRREKEEGREGASEGMRERGRRKEGQE